jgi:hypothetical protein
MPIRPEHRAFYASPEWKRIRMSILIRADNRCEWCDKPNRAKMLVVAGGFWSLLPDSGAVVMVKVSGNMTPPGVWRDSAGVIVIHPPHNECYRAIRCVLTIAHLDHNPANNDEANLAALCQRCHLVHDTRQHHANARRTRAEQCGQTWILPELEARV